MRDLLKNKEYFEQFILSSQKLTKRNIENINSGNIPESRIDSIKIITQQYSLEKFVAEYSLGKELDALSSSLKSVIDFFPAYWVPSKVKVKKRVRGKTIFLDQYMVEPYGRLLRLLSLAYLFQVPDSEFQVLVDVIDRDNISDVLYEAIIKARFPNRVSKREEEYDKNLSVILRVYNKLRKSIEQTDDENSLKLIHEYLNKDFNHKHTGFYNSHKSKADIYYGYWSFEAATVIVIMGLDDSSFKDSQYYPIDLVEYYRSNQPA